MKCFFDHGSRTAGRMNTDKKAGSLRELAPIEFAHCRRRRKESILELDSLRRPLQVPIEFAVIGAIRVKILAITDAAIGEADSYRKLSAFIRVLRPAVAGSVVRIL